MGITNMWWHYAKNLSGYTLGQGGYYSPQQYLSFAIPLNYRWRTTNWSYAIGVSGSWSRTTTANQMLYPIPDIIPSASLHQNTLILGSTSTGLGYALLGSIEHRLSCHWVAGTSIDIQRTTDYTPSHALIYLRYSASGCEGDLEMPPKLLSPYADFTG
jgi:hypothetical protein